jgi:threo-3-hydroxy-L-aspartate ammonia-lyase
MFEEILKASERLEGHAHRTPVVTSRTLDQRVGAEVFLKCENFQKVGAFKFRGAFNAIAQLSDEQKRNGVIAYSSGNHAQAIACVGAMLGVKTTVVMPYNAPKIKLDATAAYGATIITYKPEETSRESVAAELQKKHNFTLIPPFNSREVVIGQGTAALELLREISTIDTLLVPCGGGGLLSGSAIAAKGLSPSCRVIGVEPEVADDATRSFRTGVLHSVHNPPTIADGTRTASLGDITFPLVRTYVDEMVTVSEEAIIETVQFLFFRTKMVVEPSGVLGVAALLSGKVKHGKYIGAILSGGNVDGPTMTRILQYEKKK